MPDINESIFKAKFEQLMLHFKRFYLMEICPKSAAVPSSREDEKGMMNLLKEMNRLCSTKKGISSSIELFEYAQVILYFQLLR